MNIKRKSLMLITILFALLLFITGCSSSSVNENEAGSADETQKETEEKVSEEESEKENEKVASGELRVAMSAAPTTLDQVTSTNTSTRDVARLMFETLLTVNSKY